MQRLRVQRLATYENRGTRLARVVLGSRPCDVYAVAPGDRVLAPLRFEATLARRGLARVEGVAIQIPAPGRRRGLVEAVA